MEIFSFLLNEIHDSNSKYINHTIFNFVNTKCMTKLVKNINKNHYLNITYMINKVSIIVNKNTVITESDACVLFYPCYLLTGQFQILDVSILFQNTKIMIHFDDLRKDKTK